MGGADHTGLKSQGIADVLVHLGGGVVSHDEVVAVGVLHLMHRDGLGEREDAPVGEAAHDAAILEDEGADSLGDSMGEDVSQWTRAIDGSKGSVEAYSFTSERLPGRTYLESACLVCRRLG